MLAGSDRISGIMLGGSPRRKIILKMLTWKRLTTVSKYATALPEDQTAVTLIILSRHTSIPGTWPLGRQLGLMVLN